MPRSLLTIGESAFSGCTGITQFNLNEGLTVVGKSAFTNCKSLKTIFLPVTATSIGASAFSNCTSLTTLIVPKSVVTISADMLSGNKNDVTIYCDDGAPVKNYTFSGPTSVEFVDSIDVPDTIDGVIFNSDLYSAYYPEIAECFNNKAGYLYLHWKTFGIYDDKVGESFSGRIVSRGSYVFNAAEYAFYNPTLVNEIGNDPATLLDHFVTSGCNELRTSSKHYSGTTYAALHPGKTGEELVRLYLTNGATEDADPARTGDSEGIPNTIEGWIFDADLYRAKNPDLAAIYGNDDAGLYQHWINCGMAEGRIGSYIFDPGYYKEKYADLDAAFGGDYNAFYNHFLQYGINEGRKASWYYSGSVYKENYGFDDMTYEEMIWHYTKYGRYEGRNATGIEYDDQLFCADYYRANNPDVVAYYGGNPTDAQLYYHWKYNGVNERRSGSPVYDYKYYIANNTDVTAAYTSALDIYNHFNEVGSAEGRASSELFNLSAYKKYNPDLVKAFGDDNRAYYVHYAQCGYKEGRKATFAN
jgi:hypothetical protein